jgi:hypothetical protein
MKVVTTGFLRWAWARTVALPPFFGPLKIVIGEEAGIGACSGKELDDRRARALADDGALARFARLLDRGRLELARPADRQAGGVKGAVAVVFDDDRFQDRRQLAVDGVDLDAAADRDRGVLEAGKLGRREAAFGVDDDVAGAEFDRVCRSCQGQDGEGGEQGDQHC